MRFDDLRPVVAGDGKVYDEKNMDVLLTFKYSTQTKFSKPKNAKLLLESAKTPPLNVKNLHKMGLTGKGVNVAIIDQPLALHHPEYASQIEKYFEVGPQGELPSSMHGPLVASLLAGKNIGVAPDAKIFYFSCPSWEYDASYFAAALLKIVELNKKLDPKIKFVSVSADFHAFKNYDKWLDALDEAEKEGIEVIDLTAENGFILPCSVNPITNKIEKGFLYHPFPQDRIIKKLIGNKSLEAVNKQDNVIFVPNAYRTVAESYVNDNDFEYCYIGPGGLSLSVPYAVGLLCLGQEANPYLSAKELKHLLLTSASPNLIISPEKFIVAVRSRTAPN